MVAAWHGGVREMANNFTPSRLRRQGRNAWFRGGDPADHNPYKSGWGWEMRARDWLDGWKQAEAVDARRREDADYRCVNGHDRCYGGTSAGPKCPYCERVIDGDAS